MATGTNQQQIVFGAQIAQLTNAINQVKAQLQSLHDFAEGLTERLKEMFTVKEILEFINRMGEIAEKTESFAAVLGISTESVGQLSGIAKLTGTDMESLATSVERISLNVQRAQRDAFSPGNEALRVLGLRTKDLIGLPADQYFEKLAEAASKFAPSMNLTNALTEIGGRSFAKLVPTLLEGAEQFKKYREEIDKTGSELSGPQAKAFVETKQQITLLGLSLQGVGNTVYGAFRPAIEGVVRTLTDLVQTFNNAIKEGGALGGLMNALANIAKVLATAFSAVVSTAEALFVIGSTPLTWEGLKSLPPALENVGSKWKTTFNAIWSDVQKLHAEVHKEPPAAMDFGGRQRLAAQMEEFQSRIRLADIAYQTEVERINTGLKVFELTESEKTSALRSALAERLAVQRSALSAEMALPGLNPAQLQKLRDQMKEIDAKFIKDDQKILDEGRQATFKEWEKDLGMLQTAWDSQLKGLLNKTTTWKEAMRNIVQDLVIDMIKAIESFFIKKAALLLTNLIGPNPLEIANAMKSITTNMGAAYAGFVANLALPLGPAAPAAAAALTAETTATALSMVAAGSAESGAWEIPATSPWLLHRGETVLPSKAADTFRQMAQGGGIGGGHATFNITAMDGQDVLRVLNRHAATFARVMAGHMAANPSTHR